MTGNFPAKGAIVAYIMPDAELQKALRMLSYCENNFGIGVGHQVFHIEQADRELVNV
jgi:hypothetical protein